MSFGLFIGTILKALAELGKALGLIDSTGACTKPIVKVQEELHIKTKIGEMAIAQLLGLLNLPDYIQKEVKSPGAGTKESVITIDKDIRLIIKSMPLENRKHLTGKPTA